MIPAPLRLGDVVRLTGYLTALCTACLHQRILPLQPLRARFGDAADVAKLGPRLVCTMCGSRGAKIEAKIPP